MISILLSISQNRSIDWESYAFPFLTHSFWHFIVLLFFHSSCSNAIENRSLFPKLVSKNNGHFFEITIHCYVCASNMREANFQTSVKWPILVYLMRWLFVIWVWSQLKQNKTNQNIRWIIFRPTNVTLYSTENDCNGTTPINWPFTKWMSESENIRTNSMIRDKLV